MNSVVSYSACRVANLESAFSKLGNTKQQPQFLSDRRLQLGRRMVCIPLAAAQRLFRMDRAPVAGSQRSEEG